MHLPKIHLGHESLAPRNRIGLRRGMPRNLFYQAVGLGVCFAGALLIVLFGAKGWLLFTLIASGLAVLGLGIAQPVFVVAFSILVCSSVGALAPLLSLEIGRTAISLSGMMTAALLLSASIALLAHIREVKRRWLGEFLPFWLFVGFVFLRLAGSPSFSEGLRTALPMASPLVIGVLAKVCLWGNERNRRRVEKALLYAATLPVLIIVASIPMEAIEYTSMGFYTVFSGRVLALFLLVVLSFGLASWRLGGGRAEQWQGACASALAVAVILLSLSRTATAIAVGVLVPMRLLKMGSWRLPRIAIGSAIGVGLIFLSLQWQPLRSRFLAESQLELREIPELVRGLETAGRSNLWSVGRSNMWSVTWESAVERPLFGHGTGSARMLIKARYVTLEHPHNEYLRVLHDQGVIGIALLLWAWMGRVFHHWNRWIRNETQGRRSVAKYHMAATLAALCVLFSSLTDNTLMYVFVLIPVFVIFAMADLAEARVTEAISPLLGSGAPDTQSYEASRARRRARPNTLLSAGGAARDKV